VDNTKYCISQLIISHPHNDHISAIEDFNTYFYPELLTCPNDNTGMKESEKINWELFEENPNIDILKKALIDREPPLRPRNPLNQFIYYLAPKEVECEKNLTNGGETYCNNISIVTYLRVNGTRVLLPGDIMKNGMGEIIKENSSLRNRLQEGG
jgi:beta-lactamase superfamily II metal-dependent hydrolase